MEVSKLTGKGIGVAVLDTGIYPHIDFDGRITGFRDFLQGKKQPYDDNGHGTHVAGIIGGNGKASQGRYCGIAPGCSLVSLKILDKRGNGNMKDVVKALRWLKMNGKQLGIRIVNISVGTVGKGDRNSALLIQGVEELWDEGFIVVTAAGNMGPEPGSITAPGSSRKVITVGSSDLLDPTAGISGRGPTKECVCKPDILTPGVGIVACSPGIPYGYAVKSGTSMSTPRVSGAIALMLEKDPFLTNVEIKMLLKEAARDLGYERNRQGWGELDINAFLKS